MIVKQRILEGLWNCYWLSFIVAGIVCYVITIAQVVKKSFLIWMDLNTILSATWRFFVAIVDWRTGLRRLMGRPIVDVVFISNMRDKTDRRRYLGTWRPRYGHFNGPRYWLKGVVSRIRIIDIVTEDLATSKGRKKAKEYFIRAVQWAEKNGAKVILLAAGTKRLFNEDGAKLKQLFPNLIFTIGDNGTMFILKEETIRALEEANLRPGLCKIGILGPYGFLGEMMVQVLKEKGYDLVGAGPNISALSRIGATYGIEICEDFSEIGKVDAVVACTHSEKIRLTADNIDLIRKPDKKLLVIDVAEPSNLKYREFQKCKHLVIRQDAGNAYSKNLKYVLGAVSYKMVRLTQGVTFGCFAEAMSIASVIKQRKGVEVWISEM